VTFGLSQGFPSPVLLFQTFLYYISIADSYLLCIDECFLICSSFTSDKYHGTENEAHQYTQMGFFQENLILYEQVQAPFSSLEISRTSVFFQLGSRTYENVTNLGICFSAPRPLSTRGPESFSSRTSSRRPSCYRSIPS